MQPILLWLLIDIGSSHFGSGGFPTSVIARFAKVEQCERVAEVIRTGRRRTPPEVHCIQAEVYP